MTGDLGGEWLAMQHLYRCGWPAHGVGIENIVVSGRLSQPWPSGFRACVLPIFDDGGEELLDLLAFRPQEPEKWWYRRGARGLALGAGQLLEAQLTGTSIRLWPTPLHWVAAGGDGAVLLDDAAELHGAARFAERDAALIEWWRAAA